MGNAQVIQQGWGDIDVLGVDTNYPFVVITREVNQKRQPGVGPFLAVVAGDDYDCVVQPVGLFKETMEIGHRLVEFQDAVTARAEAAWILAGLGGT